MTSLRIGSHATVADLEAWALRKDSLKLILSRRSRFGPFAEAVAIAQLYQASRAGLEISATCNYKLKDQDLRAPFSQNLGILNSLFGFALLDIAENVFDSRKSNIRDSLLEALWEGVRASNGIVGSGRYASVVCRDPDTPLPQPLRDISIAGGARAFPQRTTFSRLLRGAAKEMGIGPDLGTSEIENKLVTFLYESARNAHEHARTDTNFKALSGIRGIVIEKIRAETAESLRRRTGLPELLKQYISRAWRVSPGSLVSITVLDTGPGIHHRMPQRAGEGDFERLKRSFLPGESSKPRGVAHRGEGLSNIINALSSSVDFSPFLYVQSAELTAYVDFSLEYQRDASGDFPGWLELDHILSTSCGTALTLIWPMSISTHNQIPLDI